MAKWRRTAWSLLGFVLFLTAPLSGAVAQSIEFFGSIYDLDPPVFESSGLEQLVGDDDTTPLNQFHPQDLYRQLARPVGRLAVEFKTGKSAYCTAALVSDDLILTNAHCIFDASGNNLVRAGVLSMGYLSAGVKEGTDQYEVATSSPIEFGTPGPEGAPDYVILRVKSGDPGKTWGTVQLSHDSPLDGGSLAIMHHPRGFPMVVSAGGKCRSTRLSQNDVFHICDTQGGSSGAPVFALGSSKVVAIHYRKVGLSENAALRIDHLLDASPLLRGIVAAYGAAPTPTPNTAAAPDGGADTTTAGDYQKGLDAYNKGDYAAALREWKPLAERGHAGAQTYLGWMYATVAVSPGRRGSRPVVPSRCGHQGDAAAQGRPGPRGTDLGRRCPPGRRRSSPVVPSRCGTGTCVRAGQPGLDVRTRTRCPPGRRRSSPVVPSCC